MKVTVYLLKCKRTAREFYLPSTKGLLAATGLSLGGFTFVILLFLRFLHNLPLLRRCTIATTF